MHRGFRDRSRFTGLIYPALGLALCFGIGLAGGTAYKLWPTSGKHAAPLAQNEPKAATPVLAEASQPHPMPAVPTAPAPATQDTPATSHAAPVQTGTHPAPLASAPPPFAQIAVAASAPADAASRAATGGPTPLTSGIATAKTPVTRKPLVAQETQHLVLPPQAVALHPPAPQTVALHPPVPMKAASKPGTGPFRIQFGAFANGDNAQRMQAALEATGMKIEVSHQSGASGHTLFVLRSAAYSDYDAALSAARSVQDQAKHLANAVPVNYAIVADRNAPQLEAAVP